jgi:membrane protease YdiL (CAAX protease family)
MREHADTPRLNRVSANAILPLALLVGGAAIEAARPLALMLLVIGLLATLVRTRRQPGEQPGVEELVYAGCAVVALNLAWSGIPLDALVGAAAECQDRLAPFALVRVLGAVFVLASLAVAMRLLRARPTELGLRWPSRPWVLVSLAAVMTIGPGAVFLGPILAEPFFGPLSPMTADLRSLVPALSFALANASMEEVAYRGALLRWLTPVTGSATALALQAIVFGLAHGVGTDFIGSPLPVMAATAAAGLILGALALRTGSLLLPIAIHLALDIPVFYGKVCLGT